MKGRGDTMRLLLWGVAACMLAACANMGRPQGGARDEIPPKYVRSNPKPGARNFNNSRMTVTFDENVQLDNAFEKVVVSPAQKTPPQVSANGRTLTVDFKDTLRSNTTYTVDFADAIKDLNEGNVLDGFALDFSTGDTIDTLRISGMVLQAENLEPAQGMLVGVYSAYTDTSLTKVPLDRIARTNQSGQFTIRNLPAGAYKVFAINDINRDYRWDRTEDIAFFDTLIVPTTEELEITDTLYASTGEDSLVTRPGIRYLPNDVLLTWFNTNYKQPYLADYGRPDRRRITINLGSPNDSLPTLTVVSGAPGIGRTDKEWALLQSNLTADSLTYWIADTLMASNSDSLMLAVRYQKLDTLENRIWATDTLRFFFKDTEKNKKKKKKDKKEEEIPLFTVDSITGDTTFLPPPDFEFLKVDIKGNNNQELGRPMIVETNLPVESLDTAGIHLECMTDTVWMPVAFSMRPDTLDPVLRSRIEADWTPGAKYRINIDTMAVRSIFGPFNRPVKKELTAKKYEDYANLNVSLPGLDSVQAVVELLNQSDVPVYRTIKPVGQTRAQFKLLAPGTYYMRLFIDDNLNAKWDTGDPLAPKQPEEVYYFAKKLNLKENWDIDQSWDITELPLDRQKPYAIKKNKPKLKRGEKPPVDTEENEEDTFGNPFGPTDGRNDRGGFGSGGRRQNQSTNVFAR